MNENKEMQYNEKLEVEQVKENFSEKNKVQEYDFEKLSIVKKCLLVFLFPGILLMSFLLTGFLMDGAWRINWLLFLVIPVYWSGLYAFYKKNFIFFLFPLIVIIVYLFIGLSMPNNKGWHPYWIMFVEIPLYYLAVFLIKTFVEKYKDEEDTTSEINEKVKEVKQEKVNIEKVDVENIVLKEKQNVSNRRLKKAAQHKEKKVKVIKEKTNFDKEKNKVKLKADIIHNHEEEQTDDANE